MFGFNNDKEMVERPENEKKFSLKNKTVRIIFFITLGFLLVLFAILGALIAVYYLGKWDIKNI